MSNIDQYTETDAEAHDISKRTIANALANFGKGKENAISAADLAEKTPVSSSTVRDLVAEVRSEYNIPIASCSNGYFVIAEHDEFIEVMERIEGRVETAKERQSDIANAWNGKGGGW